MRKLIVILMAMVPMAVWAQFAPAAGQPGTTAMRADSSAFVAWATGCVAEPGPMNITNPSAGMAGQGWPASNVIGYPEGTYGVTCLGDGGMATVTFASPICNRPGPDFAVFENGFENAQAAGMYFLELGFVEVSSDGENFFRFPAISMVQTETQIGGMGCIDPQQIHNFASKYEAMYGTPFDLDEVPDNPLLNKNNITHVRVVDVIGNIDPAYCTYDSQGHPVNDPWPTPFASCGMDLDAVGVIHDIEHFPNPPQGIEENENVMISIYPNPANDFIRIETMCTSSVQRVEMYSVTGQLVLSSTETEINVSELEPGVYFIRVNCGTNVLTERVIIK
ncbi:MAG: T9SS type A sorting domain-containing protein [Bacteroidales bacterium]|nr:T9SS type A sorting domain-containing protein [Bacteroidales bacterium]